MTDQPTCKTCPHRHSTGHPASHSCRRYPPQGHPLWVHKPPPALAGQRPQKPDLVVETAFPFINLDWWCGEHPARKLPEPMTQAQFLDKITGD